MKNRTKYIIIATSATIFALILIIFTSFSSTPQKYVKYSEFKARLYSGDVVSSSFEDNKLNFSLKGESGDFYTDNPENPELKEELLLNGVEITDAFESKDFYNLIDILFYLIFFLVAGVSIYKFMSMFSGNDFKIIKNNKTKFTDICGMDDIKEDMKKTVDLLKNPSKYQKLGIRPPKGIILEGPPGNGKTLFARALSGEAGINFIPTKGADFQSAMMSIGPRKIKGLFKKARKNAPCIIFIDEFDSIGERRNYSGTGVDKENNRIITAMLNEMDGFDNRDGVLVIGATNSYSSLDSALIRPGRFDKKFNISNPDTKTIKELINMYSKGKKISKDVNIDSLSKCFNGISSSAVETIINEASMEAFKNNHNEITLDDIIMAGKKTNIIKINKI